MNYDLIRYMKKWLKENWFKVIILLLLIWVAFHFVAYLDRQHPVDYIEFYERSESLYPLRGLGL